MCSASDTGRVQLEHQREKIFFAQKTTKEKEILPGATVREKKKIFFCQSFRSRRKKVSVDTSKTIQEHITKNIKKAHKKAVFCQNS
jgi:hypothetical protein